MRILHTSDWHLGRSFHGVDLLRAQVEVLESLIEVVRTESVDVVVVAGDIYDRAVPAADAVGALDHVLAELRNAGAVVVGISGNHDSAVRVGFAERVLTSAGVTLRGDIAASGQPVIVPDGDGANAVAFYPIPYLEPEPARLALGTPEAKSHERLLQVALDRSREDLSTRSHMRSVAIVHAFVAGGESSDSELALSVGGSAEVGLKGLKGFDYVALGHLHARQALGDGTARYSGTPLPYSFSERSHTKGIWLIDLPPTGAPRVKPIDLPVHRPLQQLRDTLDSLLTSSAYADAENSYVQALLTDAVLPLGAMEKLRRRFPHAVALEHQPPQNVTATGTFAERVKGRTDLELSMDFIEHVTGVAATPQQQDDLVQALEGQTQAHERAA
jgi:exonuclease SbcD